MSQKYKKATENIVKVCLKIKPEYRVVIISDKARKDIGKAIAEKAKEITPTKFLQFCTFLHLRSGMG